MALKLNDVELSAEDIALMLGVLDQYIRAVHVTIATGVGKLGLNPEIDWTEVAPWDEEAADVPQKFVSLLDRNVQLLCLQMVFRGQLAVARGGDGDR